MKEIGYKDNTIVVIAFTLLLLKNFVKSDGEAGGSDCKAVMTALLKGQLANVKACLSEMEFQNGKEKSEKMMCVIVCAMKKSGFLNAEGETDAVGSLAFLESQVPPDMRDRIMETFMGCHEHLGIIQTSGDPYCKTYEPMLKCAQGLMNKVCLPPVTPAPE